MEEKTIPSNLIFLQVVPKDDYFAWQIDIQCTNFRKFGISDKMEILVWFPKNYNQFEKWEILEKKYPEASFFYYEDSRS